MICPLVSLHLLQKSRQNGSIDPPHVPVFVFILWKTEVSFFCAILQNFVLSVTDIYHERLASTGFVEIFAHAHQLSRSVVDYVELVSLFVQLCFFVFVVWSFWLCGVAFLHSFWRLDLFVSIWRWRHFSNFFLLILSLVNRLLEQLRILGGFLLHVIVLVKVEWFVLIFENDFSFLVRVVCAFFAFIFWFVSWWWLLDYHHPAALTRFSFHVVYFSQVKLVKSCCFLDHLEKLFDALLLV